MPCSLVIGGRSPHARIFHDLEGRSILGRFPGRVLLFLDAPSPFDHGDNVAVEVIRYMDPEIMLEVARRYHEAEGIRSISTLCEKSVEVVARLRQALGIAGVRPEEARRHRDKVTMKQRLDQSGLRVPQWCLASDRAQALALLERCGRLVLKPRDGQGSRQVSFIDSPQALDQAFSARRDWDAYEVEEYIDGCLYHTNSIVIDGEVRFTAIGQYLPGMGNIDYTAGAPFVSLIEPAGDLHARLEAFSVEAIAALGLRDGVTHMELFHTGDDQIVFCETALRPGGGGIVHMIEAQYGINMSLAAMLADAGMGERALETRRAEPQRIGLIGLRNTAMGTVSLDSGRRLDPPWLKLLEVEVRDGDFRPPSSHCTDFTALAILAADGMDQFRQRIGQVSEHFDQCLRLV